jgi:hypothetical protein
MGAVEKKPSSATVGIQTAFVDIFKIKRWKMKLQQLRLNDRM